MSPLQILSLLLALSTALNLAVAAGLLAHRSGVGIPQAILTGAGDRSHHPGHLPRRRRRLPMTQSPAFSCPASDQLGQSTTDLCGQDYLVISAVTERRGLRVWSTTSCDWSRSTAVRSRRIRRSTKAVGSFRGLSCFIRKCDLGR